MPRYCILLRMSNSNELICVFPWISHYQVVMFSDQKSRKTRFGNPSKGQSIHYYIWSHCYVMSSSNCFMFCLFRCVVVHGTNRLLIEENVAYDTLGHCYMTEDGIEVNNRFTRNLGAQTGTPSKVLIKDGVSETDSEPATFWMTNPSNYLVDNVAAGSRSAGFWIEPFKRGERAYLYPDMNPSYEPLGAFDGNVAHSNGDPDDSKLEVAAVRTYASSRFHEPLEKAIYKRMRVYRNNNKVSPCQGISKSSLASLFD